jgi:ABC-2 type transport system permease protein
MQGLIVLVLLLAVGVRFQGGVTGVIAIFVILILFAMSWSCVGMIAALRTQNARLVQSLFVVVFPFLYITTSQAPKELLSPTFATLATYNPVTYVIEGVRALVLYGWGSPAVGEGFLTVLVLFFALVSLTLASFQKAVK